MGDVRDGDRHGEWATPLPDHRDGRAAGRRISGTARAGLRTGRMRRSYRTQMRAQRGSYAEGRRTSHHAWEHEMRAGHVHRPVQPGGGGCRQARRTASAGSWPRPSEVSDAGKGSAGKAARRENWMSRSERRLQTSTPRWAQRAARQEMAREGRPASPRTAAAQHTPSEKCGGSIRSERTQRQPSR